MLWGADWERRVSGTDLAEGAPLVEMAVVEETVVVCPEAGM